MLRIVTFGEATLWLGRERIAPSASRMFALALYLGAERGREVPRAVLQTLLFPESDERSAGHSLRQLVYRVRQLGAPLVASADAIAADPEHVTDDYTVLVQAPVLEPAQIALVAKGFLPGYAPTFSEAYTEWLDAFRGRTTLEIRRKVLAAVADARGRCNWPGMAEAARAGLALDPLNEDATTGLAEALAMMGSKAEALARLDRYEAELPPDAEQSRAAARRLRQRIASRVAEPSPISLRDMPLVGREDEMRRLTAALAHARANGGGVALITGEPGIGKTRLLAEFERVAALSGAQTARVVCRSATAHQPLSPFIELTRSLLQMPGALGCSPEALEGLRRLSHHKPRVQGVPDAGLFDAESIFTAITTAILDLVSAVASEAPLVLIIDDAHWADEASVEMLRALAAGIESSPCLLVLSGRTAWSPYERWPEAPSSPRLSLGPLNKADAESLLRASIRDKLVFRSAAAIDWMLRCAGGNPLFLQLIGDQSSPTLLPPEVPVAITDLLRQRLGGLDGATRGVLETCALLGRHATAQNVESALELPTIALVSVLRELESLGLIERAGDRLTIGHPLAADLISKCMTPAVELIVRRRVVSLLAHEFEQTGDAMVLWDCADHWESLGDANGAAKALLGCASHSLSLGRPGTAMKAFQRALALRAVATDVRTVVLREAALCSGVLGDWGRTEALLADIGRLSSDDTGVSSDASTRVLQLEARRATDTGGSDCSEASRILADARAPRDTRLRAGAFVVSHAEDFFDSALAESAREQVANAFGDAAANDWALRRFWIIYHTCFGSAKIARNLSEDALAELRRKTPKPELINHHYNVAYALVRCGLHKEAVELTRSLLAQIRAWDLASQEAWSLSWLAWISAAIGDWFEAKAALGDAAGAAGRAGIPTPAIQNFTAIDVALHDGDSVAAMDLIAQLNASAGMSTSPRKRLHLVQLSVRAKRLEGIRADAEELRALSEGHRAARSLGMHDDVAFALCSALIEEERSAQARSDLREYFTRYRRDLFPVSAELARVAADLNVAVPTFD